MLSFAVLLFLVLLGVLFILDFGTDLKPGVMTKIKTLLAHFQVGVITSPISHILTIVERACRWLTGYTCITIQEL